ncbi:MAG: ATP-binding protein, partial [Proteobacteria bacterium]|nr:ATP-binding protein [Pseudomonadota bacterium]
DDQAAIRAGLVATVRKEIHTATFEFRHAHRDGGWRWLEAAGTSLLDFPCVAGVVLIARDVTARRLAEDELRQAQKLESVGRLAGGIAHDFNNLLTAIKGNLSLVLDALHGEHPVRELVAEADQATSTAAHLTHQLLAFSRKQVIAPRVLALPETIGHFQRMLGRVLGERITLSTTIAPDLWRVRIDPGQLEQILMNLTLNARDAMPAGGRLAIAASNVRLDERFAATHLAAGDYVKLEVADTGTGIADDVRAHVFEPFYTTKDVGQGTGLGLASVYGAVKQNLGHVEVGPTQPIGTTFVVYLPRTDEASEATPRARSVAPRGTETIMLVEDDDGVRKLALRVLVRQGYRVFAYDSGDAALAAVDTLAEPPQMLVTDVIMPGMNGKVLADLLRARLPALKVLFTSGYSADTIAQQGIMDAGVEFLDKPYTLDKLAIRVREILDAP